MKRATIPNRVPRLLHSLLGNGPRLATHTAARMPRSFPQIAELVRQRCRLRIRPDGSVEVAIISLTPGKSHAGSVRNGGKTGKPT